MSRPTSDWVALSPRFTPGWPWPEASFGLGPMYGDDGWCRGCGTPLVEQSGPLTMQGSGFPSAGCWTPNWLFDVVCVADHVAADLAARFTVTLDEVRMPRGGTAPARQVRPVRTIEPWYDHEHLAAAVRRRHGRLHGDTTAATCPTCGRTKWLPVMPGEVPVSAAALVGPSDVLASPERFGDGLSSFCHLLFRRPLGETLVAASPRSWDLVEVTVG